MQNNLHHWCVGCWALFLGSVIMWGETSASITYGAIPLLVGVGALGAYKLRKRSLLSALNSAYQRLVANAEQYENTILLEDLWQARYGSD